MKTIAYEANIYLFEFNVYFSLNFDIIIFACCIYNFRFCIWICISVDIFHCWWQYWLLHFRFDCRIRLLRIFQPPGLQILGYSESVHQIYFFSNWLIRGIQRHLQCMRIRYCFLRFHKGRSTSAVTEWLMPPYTFSVFLENGMIGFQNLADIKVCPIIFWRQIFIGKPSATTRRVEILTSRWRAVNSLSTSFCQAWLATTANLAFFRLIWMKLRTDLKLKNTFFGWCLF